ncbi:hypothetical protein [Caballeronia sp. ATUFL_F1_KS4A]|uniref:hypothetical protein n=1 Tax=Caballeronia sp. ATUFL_F1_KS4A TaxID=2921768 RepID=UPI0020280271|nr:hypothetical protein [Caballeronia sp. ATUFL_F1_KS4A]
MDRDQHPVWAVYDKLRTARLNVKYYCRRLQRLERIIFTLDVILLVAAPSSAIASLWFWDTPAGRIAWQSLSVVAAIIATVRPIFHLTRRVKEYESAIAAYRIMEYDLESVRQRIEQRGEYDAKLRSEFLRIVERQKAAELASPEKVADQKLLKECSDAVLSELPANSFFVPSTSRIG